MMLGSSSSESTIALLPSPEEQESDDEQSESPPDRHEPQPRRRINAVEQRVSDQGQVRVHGVELHSGKNRRVVRQAVLDGEEDSGAVEPETTDDRHEVGQVGNLMADSGQETGETDIEDCLENDHGDDKEHSPGDHFCRWDDRDEYRHDDDSRYEVEEVPHDDRDRQRRAWELETFDHRGPGPDSSRSPGHRFAGELEEEDTDDQVTDEVLDST